MYWIELSQSGQAGMTVKEGAEGSPEGHQTLWAMATSHGKWCGKMVKSGFWREKELSSHPDFTAF